MGAAREVLVGIAVTVIGSIVVYVVEPTLPQVPARVPSGLRGPGGTAPARGRGGGGNARGRR